MVQYCEDGTFYHDISHLRYHRRHDHFTRCNVDINRYTMGRASTA